MSHHDRDVEIAAFLRNKGVTRCPTACVVPMQGSPSLADQAALQIMQLPANCCGRKAQLDGKFSALCGFGIKPGYRSCQRDLGPDHSFCSDGFSLGGRARPQKADSRSIRRGRGADPAMSPAIPRRCSALRLGTANASCRRAGSGVPRSWPSNTKSSKTLIEPRACRWRTRTSQSTASVTSPTARRTGCASPRTRATSHA
jgi:hypothetical protein